MAMTTLTPPASSLAAEIARDLALLARLNEAPPDGRQLEDLAAVPVGDWFGLRLDTELYRRGVAVTEAALDAMPRPITAAALDELAVDFTNIHYVNAYRATPTESPWMDKDGLERQQPMFAVAEWYRRHSLAAVNRNLRPEDHLVLQLQFLSHLASHATSKADLAEMAAFMDAHILRWIGRFAERIAARCATPYYAGLVTLLAGYLEECRDLLAVLADAPRPAVETESALGTGPATGETVSERYVPGLAPSW